MKWIALSLVMIKLLLSMLPSYTAITAVRERSNACCGSACNNETDDSHQQSQGQEKNCSSSVCNPFQLCACCVFIHQEVSKIPYSVNLLARKTSFLEKKICFSKCIPECWQPPKLA